MVPSGSGTGWAAWAWWRGPSNTGAASSAVTAANVSTLQQAWAADLGSPAYGTPAVAGNLVIVPSLNTLDAVDATSGAIRWSFTSPEGYKLFSGPTIIGTLVISSTAYYGAATYALDAATGRLAWEKDWGTSYSGYSAAAPVSPGEAVIGLANQAEPPCSAGAVIAVNPATGAVLWRHDTTPVFGSGDGVWAAANVDHLGDVVATTGNPCASPDPGEGDAILALSAQTGQRRWMFTSSEALNGSNSDLDFGSTPVDAGGVIVAASKSGWVYGLDASSGILMWKYQLSAASCCPETSGSISSPAWDGSRIYVGGGSLTNDGTGRFAALRNSGSVLWEDTSPAPVQAPPT
ncbi:MAG TPA: PQQ-binding-like beta-propeller repeat protein, partial [Candidatus Dormibacteraeota bacterium]|nr:PQQ-binding-like beta-propeller repeat protein [Candidatus Dormibacteraeota bacterium]